MLVLGCVPVQYIVYCSSIKYLNPNELNCNFTRKTSLCISPPPPALCPLWSALKTIPNRPMVWLIHHFILHPMFGFSDGIVPSHKSHLIGGCFAIHVLVLEHTVAFG